MVNLYPPPKHNKIIEPFVGSARYSLKWFERDVLLVDKYEIIINVWRYLQSASKKDILSLPQLKPSECVDDFDLTIIEKYLIGFCINGGSAQPKKTAQKFNVWPTTQKMISENLYKIKHWQIEHKSFDEIENQNATWFVDPPYQFGGEHYVKSNKQIDFPQLAEWCKNRIGQTIVCENTKADWMDFKPMKEMQGSMYKTTETIWSNHPTNYDNIQQRLF